jgi:hypothetical protein
MLVCLLTTDWWQWQCQMSATMEQNVGKRLAAGFTPGTIYGIPTMTNTGLNLQTDMASDMKADTAANKSVHIRASMATSSTIDDSSDDHRSDYSLIQCLHALVSRMHLLGELKNLFVGLYLTFVLYLGALPSRFYTRAGEQTSVMMASAFYWILELAHV